MRNRCFFSVFTIVILFSCTGLFAFGKKEAPEEEEMNPQWTICITALDVSALPLSRQIMGDTVARKLSGVLSNLNYRFRGEEEYAYYRDYAWAKARSEAAVALRTKRDERDLLIFKGNPSWKYRKELKVVDEAILKLEEDMANVDALAPVVKGEPEFKLVEGNINGVFPPPPKPGEEYRFCSGQKADAFLVGSLSEYHGRIFLDLKMYTLYARAYSFEDSVLFSSVDLDAAMYEISNRLIESASESLPAGILVHASPIDAMVLIDGSYAGRGDMEMRTHSPGKAEISVHADNHSTTTIPLELHADELAELYIDLTPLGMDAFEVNVQDNTGSKVFLGSMYMGETPVTLELPRNEYSYISVETEDGKVGTAVYRNGDIAGGSANFTREDNGGIKALFSTTMPISPEEKRVENARRRFYRTYGAFWIILPASLLASGIAGNHTGSNAEFVQTGSNFVWGATLGLTLFQLFRYLYVSGGDSMPIVKKAEL